MKGPLPLAAVILVPWGQDTHSALTAALYTPLGLSCWPLGHMGVAPLEHLPAAVSVALPLQVPLPLLVNGSVKVLHSEPRLELGARAASVPPISQALAEVTAASATSVKRVWHQNLG